jgi:putative ABC transport system permease protein
VTGVNIFLQDLRYGLRMHAKDVVFTGIAVFTLALGIGASTAVFSVVNAILVKPLPYPNSERVVAPWRLAPPGVNLGYNEIPWGLKNFQVMSQATNTFQTLAAFKSDSFNLTGVGEPVLVEGIRASAGFFATLGVTPVLGRAFTAAEDRPGREHEVVLSHVLWQDRFGGDPAVVGRSVNLNGDAYTVIGVMPAGFAFPRAEEMPGGFDFPRQAQLWVPLAPAAARPNDPDDLAVMGLLRPGITVTQTQAEMNVLSKRMESEFPNFKGWFNSRVIPLNRQVAGDSRGPLLLMLGAVGVVLLIACSNVANLLLARSVGRKTEFTLRAALGAGQGRLIFQVLIESLMLAVAGGLLGTLLAEGAVHLVKAFGPSNIPRLHEVSLDLRVFGFLLTVTLLSGTLFGLAPALSVARENLVSSLNEGGQRSGGSAAASRIRDALFISQVALALVLLAASALLVQTFFRLVRVNPGFAAEHVLTFELSLPASEYTDTHRIVSLYQRGIEGLRSIPGVQAAGIVETVPMDGATEGSVIRILNHPQPTGKENPFANYTIASPGYFSAVGTPVLRGRAFRESDTADAVPVTVINRAMAKKFWPDEDPIGQQVGLGSPRFPAMTIVGIVADVKHLSLREDPGPEMYVPYTQNPYPSMLTMHAVLRTNADPRSVTGGVREAVRSLDPELPVAKLMTLTEVVNNSLAGTRFAMLLLAAFGALALTLASIGMYGVISYGVTQRTREIGIRVALGAPRSRVIGMVLGQGARLTGLGIAAGLICALGVNRVMSSVLYGVHSTDALTFAGVALLLVGVALLACYLPARRAVRVEPTIALRV